MRATDPRSLPTGFVELHESPKGEPHQCEESGHEQEHSRYDGPGHGLSVQVSGEYPDRTDEQQQVVDGQHLLGRDERRGPGDAKERVHGPRDEQQSLQQRRARGRPVRGEDDHREHDQCEIRNPRERSQRCAYREDGGGAPYESHHEKASDPRSAGGVVLCHRETIPRPLQRGRVTQRNDIADNYDRNTPGSVGRPMWGAAGTAGSPSNEFRHET